MIPEIISKILCSLTLECEEQIKGLKSLEILSKKSLEVREAHEEKIKKYPESRWKGRSRSAFYNKYVIELDQQVKTINGQFLARQERVYDLIGKLKCELDTHSIEDPDNKEASKEILNHELLKPGASIDLLTIDDCLNAKQYFLNFGKRLEITQVIETKPKQQTQELNKPVFDHSSDFAEVSWNQKKYYPSVGQRIVLEILHDAWKSGRPTLTQESIIDKANWPSNTKVRNIFRKSLLWKTLVISPANGRYRLNLPDPL